MIRKMILASALAAIGAIGGCSHNGTVRDPDPMGNPDPNLRHQNVPPGGTNPDMSSGNPGAVPTTPQPFDTMNHTGTSQQNGGSSSQTGTPP